MGFMDKVKAAAQDVAAETKKATAQGKSKLEQGQIRKKMDEAARALGWLVFRERTEGTPAGAEADQLIAEITAHQSELATLEAGPAEATPPAPSPTSETDSPAPTPTDDSTP